VLDIYDVKKYSFDHIGDIYAFESNNYGYKATFDKYIYTDVVSPYTHLGESTSFNLESKLFDDASDSGFDRRVGITVKNIICQHFELDSENTSDKIVLYHCNWADGRQDKRQMKFNRWYEYSTLKSQLIHETISINIQNKMQHLGFLCHQLNPYYSEILAEFLHMVERIRTYENIKLRIHADEEAI
jgi:hypothetical protein